MNFFFKESNSSRSRNLSQLVDKNQPDNSATIDLKKTERKINNQVKGQIQNQANLAENQTTQKPIKANPPKLLIVNHSQQKKNNIDQKFLAVNHLQQKKNINNVDQKLLAVNQLQQKKNISNVDQKPLTANQSPQNIIKNTKKANTAQNRNFEETKNFNLSKAKPDSVSKTKINIKFKIQNFFQSIKTELIIIKFFDFVTFGFIFNLLVSHLSHLFIKHLIYFKKSIFNINEYLLVAILGALLSILHLILFLQSIFKNSKNRNQFEFNLLIGLIIQLTAYFLIGLVQFFGQMSYWDHKYKVLAPYASLEVIKLSTEMIVLLILILKSVIYLRKKLVVEFKKFFTLNLT